MREYSLLYLLLCLLVIMSVTIAVYFTKRLNKTRVIFCTGVVLVLLEIAKQILMGRIYASYSWSDFPAQLCSMPMYLCILYPFIRKGQKTINLFLRSFATLGAIFAFAIPYDILSSYLLLSIHSTLWHAILLYLGVYCVVTGEQPEGKDVRNSALLYLALAMAAIVINGLLAGISDGTANMFFLGPSRPNVLILDDIYEKCGWLIESVAMICGSEVAGIIVLLTGAWLRKVFRKNKN